MVDACVGPNGNIRVLGHLQDSSVQQVPGHRTRTYVAYEGRRLEQMNFYAGIGKVQRRLKSCHAATYYECPFVHQRIPPSDKLDIL